MIYLKNNTETQAIYIPRQTVLGGGYIPSTKAYDKGYNDGLEDGKEQQKGKLSNLNVTENGQYEREDGWNVVNVNVPDLNGSYNEGYEQGKTDGANEQKSKLESISITENGTYNKEDGYNHIEVNVPDLNGSYNEGYNQGHTEGYNEGKIDGINKQKSKLESINITENGTYNREDGYNKIIVKVPDLNGSYNEGYNQGHTEGYNEGKIDGINNQKSKLETISITENGTYTKEDGYNEIVVEVPGSSGDYNKGYEQGQADAAANARVLNVTENGTYLSKFSDPIIPELVTGVYADGNNFYNYAELYGKVFNTKIAATIDSRLEFWYKGDNTLLSDPTYNLIIGAGKNNNNKNCFRVRYHRDNSSLYVNIGSSTKTVNNWDNTVWHHLIVSKAEGLWIDGEKNGDFTASNIINGQFFINGIGYDTNGTNTANGTFGMIKIDDVVIIPTADGFLNTNTGELLEVVKDGTYTFTENLPIYAEGELYKTINVNVPQEVVSCNLEDKQITPSTNDVNANGYIIINPDNGYDAMSRVSIDVSTIKSEWTTIGKNSITDYYWCPLTVSDGGIGERAKYFSLANEQTVYDENDVLIDRNNMFYLPTANNLNEFRLTKRAVKIVFPFRNKDAQHIGNLYLNDDVEQFACADKNLSSLSIIEVGINMMRFTLSNCNLLNLNKIVVHSNNNCDVTLTHNVKSTGTLYVNESNQFKNNWINALPSGWTVEYI